MADGSGNEATRVRRVFARWGRAAVLVAFGFLVLAALVVWSMLWSAQPSPDAARRLSGLDQAALEAEKLRQEILKLRLDIDTAASPLSAVLSLVPLITVVVAGAGVAVTVQKELSERREQRRQERREHEAESRRRLEQEQEERREREVESLRRFDQNFTTVIQNLGSDSIAHRASAAVSLTTFLRPEYEALHDQVLLVALANTKASVQHPQPVSRLVLRAFEQALRVRLPNVAPIDRRYVLDLSSTVLDRIDLSGLDLSGADFGFASLVDANLSHCRLARVRGYKVQLGRARLSHADLSEARLRGAQAQEAQFHDSVCVSVRLEDANLQRAEFYRARLQEAHFDDARLEGARFQGADLNNAYLRAASFDDASLRTIATGALNWRKAHFDQSIRDRLEEMSSRLGSPPSDPQAPTSKKS